MRSGKTNWLMCTFVLLISHWEINGVNSQFHNTFQFRFFGIVFCNAKSPTTLAELGAQYQICYCFCLKRLKWHLVFFSNFSALLREKMGENPNLESKWQPQIQWNPSNIGMRIGGQFHSEIWQWNWKWNCSNDCFWYITLVYSLSLCHSAICLLGDETTSFQWLRAVPVHLGPPRSNRPTTWKKHQIRGKYTAIFADIHRVKVLYRLTAVKSFREIDTCCVMW